MSHIPSRHHAESIGCDSLREQKNPIIFLTGIFFFNMISRLGIAPLLPDIETNLSINHIQAGGFFFLISSGYCLSLFGSIFLTPKFSHRSLIIASSLAVGISLLSAAASQGLFALQISMVALGLAGGFYLPSGIASLTALVRQKDWGKVLGFHQLAPNLAYIIAPLAAELVLSRQSWRIALYFYGLASLALAFSYARWGRGVAGHTNPPKLKPLKAIIHDRSILIITVIFIIGMSLNQGVFAIMPLYLNFERGIDPGWSNFMLAISRTAAFGFPLVGGWLADRFGVQRVILITIMCSALGTFLVVLLPNSWLLPALIIQASSCVCIFPLCFAVLSMVTTPQTRSIAVSVVVPVAHFLGSGVVPLGVCFLAEAGYFNFGFLGIGVFTLFSLPLVQSLEKITYR
jgi:NNP family nitrate/nitrite transporter-like MFS transporter